MQYGWWYGGIKSPDKTEEFQLSTSIIEALMSILCVSYQTLIIGEYSLFL